MRVVFVKDVIKSDLVSYDTPNPDNIIISKYTVADMDEDQLSTYNTYKGGDEKNKDQWVQVITYDHFTWWVHPNWISIVLDVGTKVRFVNSLFDWAKRKMGSVGTIKKVDHDDYRVPYFVTFENDSVGYWFGLNDVKEVKEAVFLSAGQRVRVIDDINTYGDIHIHIGDVGSIVTVDKSDDDLPYKVTFENGETLWVSNYKIEAVPEDKRTDVLNMLYDSVEDFYERFNIDVFDLEHIELYDIFMEEVREFRDEVFNPHGSPSDLLEEAADVVVTVIGLLLREEFNYADFEEAVCKVIDKNNAKTDKTHYYDEKRGKVVKRG